MADIHNILLGNVWSMGRPYLAHLADALAEVGEVLWVRPTCPMPEPKLGDVVMTQTQMNYVQVLLWGRVIDRLDTPGEPTQYGIRIHRIQGGVSHE